MKAHIICVYRRFSSVATRFMRLKIMTIDVLPCATRMIVTRIVILFRHNTVSSPRRYCSSASKTRVLTMSNTYKFHFVPPLIHLANTNDTSRPHLFSELGMCFVPCRYQQDRGQPRPVPIQLWRNLVQLLLKHEVLIKRDFICDHECHFL